MPPEGGRRPTRQKKAVPADVADDICTWLCEGRFLLDFCRQLGKPSPRTVYYWAKKDRAFGLRFERARDIGEMMIREEYLEFLDAPAAMAALAGGKRSRREFNQRFIRPIDRRLQRWRRHPARRRRRC